MVAGNRFLPFVVITHYYITQNDQALQGGAARYGALSICTTD